MYTGKISGDIIESEKTYAEDNADGADLYRGG